MKKSILFIAHSASRSGAPIVLLDLIKQLRIKQPGWYLDALLLEGGALENEFEKAAHTLFTPYKRVSKSVIKIGVDYLRSKVLGINLEDEFINNYYRKILDRQYNICFYNSIEALQFLCLLPANQIELLPDSLLYLHKSVYYYKETKSPWLPLIKNMSKVIAISKRVRNQLLDCLPGEKPDIDIVYSASVRATEKLSFDSAENNQLQVFGSGVIHHRKGLDWFFQLALEVKKRYPELPVAWTWIGSVDPLVSYLTESDANALGLDFTFTGEVNQPLKEYARRDLLVITSREEPLSLAGIERAMLGKPVMYFRDRTGFEELDENAAEMAFPYGDLAAMADKINELANNRDKLKFLGDRNRVKHRNYTVEKMAESFIPIIENA